MTATITVLPDAATLAETAAARVEDSARAAVQRDGRFLLALSGGSTPAALFRLLASPDRRERVPWRQTHVFFSDERCVPPDDPQSNYRMAQELLLGSVPVPAAQIHRWQGEAPDPAEAAGWYARGLVEIAGTPPRLDLVLLGMGPDGHTASLFPGDAALAVADAWTAASSEPHQGLRRLTLTYPTLNAARQVIFMVAGADKRAALRRALAEPPDTALPAARVHPAAGALEWLVDAATGAQTTTGEATARQGHRQGVDGEQ